MADKVSRYFASSVLQSLPYSEGRSSVRRSPDPPSYMRRPPVLRHHFFSSPDSCVDAHITLPPSIKNSVDPSLPSDAQPSLKYIGEKSGSKYHVTSELASYCLVTIDTV